MKVNRTQRGFPIIEFVDLYGSECSLQKSSLAFVDAIWLGVVKPFVGSSSVVPSQRMHLTRDQVKDLLPHLIKFCETGDI
jgi:hypothetical protein